MIKRKGKYTITFKSCPRITGFAAVAGEKESQGPLGDKFDRIIYDPRAGCKTFEQGESRFQQEALSLALSKSSKESDMPDFVFSGDLLNQCVSSSFAIGAFSVPYLGQYGACSTMAQALIMSAVFTASGAAQKAAAVTSSHFACAERQYRFPLEYGAVRTPTAQRTVTGAGACIVESEARGRMPFIEAATVGRILDPGISDVNNMGAAMAAAAADTILRYFEDTGDLPSDYDGIFTGDLGFVGSQMLLELLKKEGLNIESAHNDCGKMIFDRESQDVHAGGSGCGCAASVLCAELLPKLSRGELKNILLVATGALMSPTSSQQGLTIPSVAHLVKICCL